MITRVGLHLGPSPPPCLHACMQLISLGADVGYINPAKEAPGSALHEAASRRHEAVVEALLAAGANPFVANAAGRTPLDEAVLSGHTGVVRAIEKHALWTGHVDVKVRPRSPRPRDRACCVRLVQGACWCRALIAAACRHDTC